MIDLDDCEVTELDEDQQINEEGEVSGIFLAWNAANADQIQLPATTTSGDLLIAEKHDIVPTRSSDDVLDIYATDALTPVSKNGDTTLHYDPDGVSSLHRWFSPSSQHYNNDKHKRNSLLQCMSCHFPISKLRGLVKGVSGRRKSIGDMQPRIHGVLDRSFQFSASSRAQDKQCVGDETTQASAVVTSHVINKRQSSLGRLFSDFSSKKSEESGEAGQHRSLRRLQKKRTM